MGRIGIAALSIATALLLSACGGESAEPAATDTATDTATETAEPAEPEQTATQAPPRSPAPPSPTSEAPSAQWSTDDVAAPFSGAAAPVPTLVDLRVGTHPEGGYDRIALEFEGLPGYRIGYQSRIIYDGSGKPVDLDGNAFLQLVFNPAQAHDDAGDSTLESPPVDPVEVGYPALQAYVLNGDFEGYVSIALGLTSEVGFRVGQFTAESGNEIVYVDVAQPYGTASPSRHSPGNV